MASLQGFVQKPAESPVSFRAEFGGNGGNLVQNLCKIRTSLRTSGARTCKNGFTVVYRIDLAKVEALEPTAEPEIETGSTEAPVQTGPGTGASVAGVPGPPRPPNHPKTIHKPPTRRREAAADEEAEKILAAYPPDRLRGKAACLAQIEEAMKEGIAPEDLLQAVQAYSTDSAGFTRSKVCFSDNWFQSRRWHR